MYADSSIADSREFPGQLDGLGGLGQIGAGDHQFDTSCVHCALYHVFVVVFTDPLSMIRATVDRICEIDTNLS